MVADYSYSGSRGTKDFQRQPPRTAREIEERERGERVGTCRSTCSSSTSKHMLFCNIRSNVDRQVLLIVRKHTKLVQVELQQEVENLRRENKLITSAWYDMTTRLQSNTVILQRKSEAPRSWLGKQRAAVGGNGSQVSSAFLDPLIGSIYLSCARVGGSTDTIPHAWRLRPSSRLRLTLPFSSRLRYSLFSLGNLIEHRVRYSRTPFHTRHLKLGGP